MILPCCIFSYREDSHEAVLAARSAMLAGCFPIYVIEDLAKPLNVESRRALQAASVIIVGSNFPRHGGLYGIDCFYGICQILNRIIEQTGAQYVLKLDSDTLVLSTNRLQLAVQKKPLLYGWSSKSYAFHGCSEVISEELLLRAMKFIDRWKGVPGYANDNLPEDLGFYRMASLFDKDRCIVEPQTRSGGYGCFWRYESKPDMEHYIHLHDTVTFGNRITPEGAQLSRVESYMAQAAFLDLFEKWQIHSSSDLRLVV